MVKYAIDTNVPIVANGQEGIAVGCRLACVEFLVGVLKSHIVLLDLSGMAQEEYRTYLRPSGQPGVGDRFYQVMLGSHPDRVVRLELARRPDGELADVPQPIIDAGFDPSDRKWVALAIKGAASVATAVDTDWVEHREVLEANGVRIKFVCGPATASWFV